MALPGLDWLRARLDTTDAVSGGYQADMGHPVMGAAGFAMRALLILAWLLALIPLCLWSVGRSAWRKRAPHLN